MPRRAKHKSLTVCTINSIGIVRQTKLWEYHPEINPPEWRRTVPFPETIPKPLKPENIEHAFEVFKFKVSDYV